MINIHLNRRLPGGNFSLKLHAEIPEWGIVCIQGPSGSGKTSLLRLLAGLDTADRGSLSVGPQIWYDSSIEENIPCRERDIGMVFQDYALFPHMTVLQNLDYTHPTETHRQRLIEILELGPLLRRFPDELSGGQQQRVALGRSLARQPRLLLLDEPFSSLDGELRIKLYEELKLLHGEFPMTIILVSHDIPEIFHLATHVVRLEKGQVRSQGTPREVFLDRDISAKLVLTGRVLDIRPMDILFSVTLAVNNDILEVALTGDEAAGLHPGDSVQISDKAFHPFVQKLEL